MLQGLEKRGGGPAPAKKFFNHVSYGIIINCEYDLDHVEILKKNFSYSYFFKFFSIMAFPLPPPIGLQWVFPHEKCLSILLFPVY